METTATPQIPGVGDILYRQLELMLFSWFGAVLGVVVLSGLGLIALYFLSFHFRRAVNLFRGPQGREARYGRGPKGKSRVYRSGYAFDEGSGRWVYVNRDDGDAPWRGRRYGRSYTRYQRGDE